MLLVLTVALALVIGLLLGALGGGGAILTLPLLVYVARVEPRTAIALSLFVVGATSAVGTLLQLRARRVRWKIGAIFGLTAMAGAFAGGRMAAFVPQTVLLVAFALVMLASATAMLRRRAAPEDATVRPVALGRVLVLGAAVGAFSGLVGAGGGFLIVPALTLFGGLAMREAVATSLFVIALQSSAGLAGHLGHVELPWGLALIVTGATIAGSIAGGMVGQRVPADVLRRGFAYLVLAMGLFVLGKELAARLT